MFEISEDNQKEIRGRLLDLGSSLGVTIPAEWARDMNVEPGEDVLKRYDPMSKTISIVARSRREA